MLQLEVVMNELLVAPLVLLLAFIFFGIIPGIGAFLVRKNWREFRRRLVSVSLLPFVSYARSRNEEHRCIGQFRFFGGLEAIQGTNRIWLNDGTLSVAAELENDSVYILPRYTMHREDSPFERLEEMVPDEEPQSLPWGRISSLPSGTQLFVAGNLFEEDGKRVSRSTPKEPLLVVIYDGQKETILPRTIWGGRQRNEYWNQFTVISLITGSFSLLFVAYLLLGNPLYRIPTLFALTLSIFPIASLLPPGFIFYFFYRTLWKRARFLRAERDLLRLPLRYFISDNQQQMDRIVVLPTEEVYAMIPGKVVKERGLNLESGSQLIGIEGRIRVRSPSFRESKEIFDVDCVVFGALSSNDQGSVLTKPNDPMAEFLIIQDNPETAAQRCDSEAKRFEILAAFLIFADLIINEGIVFYILLLLIR